ncbi:hypothetical protein MRB53_014248 [Persea americana]|uniref:Uncharacterized protein n=1 Tax=Persea americana TaxID=3435 RepID=A0ACC2KAT5_PERAE|nr:hypothetical protein MRB53_014248 [Persea americana]
MTLIGLGLEINVIEANCLNIFWFRRNKIKFDGKMEFRATALSRSGTELLRQCCDINITFGLLQLIQ